MFLKKILDYLLDIISPISSNPLRDFNKEVSLKDEISLIGKDFSSRGINFDKIKNVSTIGGGDYTLEFFEGLKANVQNRVFQREYFEGNFTWNLDHVHLNLIDVDVDDNYIVAVLYPYEFTILPQVIWVYRLSKNESAYWREIIKK
jgi:predicted phosphatase